MKALNKVVEKEKKEENLKIFENLKPKDQI